MDLNAGLKIENTDQYAFENNSKLPIAYPEGENLCEECEGEVICDANECFCKRCGLVVE